MTIDQALDAARRQYAATGRLDVAAFARSHPEHPELADLLPALLELWEEAAVSRAAAAASTHAMAVLRSAMAARPSGAGAPAAGAAAAEAQAETIGAVVARLEQELGARARAELAGAGLPDAALEALRRDATPVEQATDNAAVRDIAQRIGASFRSVRLALSRLMALDRFLHAGDPALAFTRGEETGAGGRAELARRVREDLQGDGPGEDPADPA